MLSHPLVNPSFLKHAAGVHGCLRICSAILLLLGLFIGSSVTHAFGGSSQAELNLSTAEQLAATEDKLRDMLVAIESLYAGDEAFLAALAASQVAWAHYRDGQLRLIFPLGPATPGTVHPFCYALWKSRLTAARIVELQPWRDGVAQGDVCAGSIRINPDLPSLTTTSP